MKIARYSVTDDTDGPGLARIVECEFVRSFPAQNAQEYLRIRMSVELVDDTRMEQSLLAALREVRAIIDAKISEFAGMSPVENSGV